VDSGQAAIFNDYWKHDSQIFRIEKIRIAKFLNKKLRKAKFFNIKASDSKIFLISLPKFIKISPDSTL
jgi:hypothetical protein